MTPVILYMTGWGMFLSCPGKKGTKEAGIGGGTDCFAKCVLPLCTPSRVPIIERFCHQDQGKNIPIFALPPQVRSGRFLRGRICARERGSSAS